MPPATLSQATDLRSETLHDAGQATLPPGTRVRDYEVRGVLAETWSGTVHLAYDHALQRPVALEHWLPAGLSTREEGSLAVCPTPGREAAFEAGLQAFVAESRLLARFDHAGLVKVWRFWEEHGTAWRVLPVLDGPTLGAAFEAHGRPSVESEVRTWLAPLLDTLAVLHGAGTTHGALAPDRIVLLPTGPVLLGPDAARRAALAALGTPDLALDPGYAAIEQYRTSADAGDVGPWTDLHAVGALLCRAFTGEPPPPAPERLPDDPFLPLSARTLDGVRETMQAAVDAAIAPRPEQRPRHHAELRGLIGDLEAPRPPPVLVPRADPMEEPFLGARLRPEEITIPDLPLIERSAEIAEALSAAVSRPQPLAADIPTARRGAPRPAPDPEAPRTDGRDPPRATASAPLPWLDQPDPATERGGAGRRLGLLLAAFAVVAVVIGALFVLPFAGPAEPLARRPASAPTTAGAAVASPPIAASVAAPVLASPEARSVDGAAAPPAAPEPASPTPAVTAAPPPVAAGDSVPIRAAGREARCTEILQKASLEGIGAADSEFYKKECR